MSGKSTRSGVLVRQLFLGLAAVAALALSASSAFADPTGTVGINFYNGFTINEGQSGSVSLQLNVTPGNASGFAGTTTQRFNNNNVAYTAPGSTAGSTSSGVVGGGGVTQTFGSGSLQYNLPGVYGVSFNQGMSYHQTENSSYGLGQRNFDSAPGVASSVNVTVNNVAPTITSANLNGSNANISIGQGLGVTLNMTATDAGSQNTNFTINGGGAGSAGGTPGSTRTSSNVGAPIGLAPGVYAQTFQADDGITTAANGPIVRNVTVTNVAPTITSANQNGVNGSLTNVLQGATVTLNLTATDPGNDTMSFTINGGGAGSTGVQAGGSTRTSANNAVQYFTPGVFTNTFQATDQYGANALNGPATRDVTVINVAPVIASLIASEIPNIMGNGCLMFFTATSTDPGILDSALYSWDLNGDNIFGDYVSADPAPPWSSTTPTILYGLGSHTIGVMVSDNWGGFDPVNGVAYLTFECLPEPSTWVAILLSGGALAFFHRRKKRKS